MLLVLLKYFVNAKNIAKSKDIITRVEALRLKKAVLKSKNSFNT